MSNNNYHFYGLAFGHCKPAILRRRDGITLQCQSIYQHVPMILLVISIAAFLAHLFFFRHVILQAWNATLSPALLVFVFPSLCWLFVFIWLFSIYLVYARQMRRIRILVDGHVILEKGAAFKWKELRNCSREKLKFSVLPVAVAVPPPFAKTFHCIGLLAMVEDEYVGIAAGPDRAVVEKWMQDVLKENISVVAGRKSIDP